MLTVHIIAGGDIIPPPITEDDEPGNPDVEEIQLHSFLELATKTNDPPTHKSRLVENDDDANDELPGIMESERAPIEI